MVGGVLKLGGVCTWTKRDIASGHMRTLEGAALWKSALGGESRGLRGLAMSLGLVESAS